VVCAKESNDSESVSNTEESDAGHPANDHGFGSVGNHNDIHIEVQAWLGESAFDTIFEQLNLDKYPLQEILFKVNEEDPVIFNAKDSDGNLLDDCLKVTSIQFK
jgi:hypothetical protein